MHLHYIYTLKLYFHFYLYLHFHLPFCTILKTIQNVTSCEKDVNKNLLKHSWNKRKLTWLGDGLGQWISKPFDIHRHTHCWQWGLDDKPLIVFTKFITGEEDGQWSSSRWETSFKNIKISDLLEFLAMLLFSSLCSHPKIICRKLQDHQNIHTGDSFLIT